MSTPTQGAYLGSLLKSISRVRLEAFRKSPQETDFDLLGRYAWNMAVCEAFYPTLHTFEVALRNAVFHAVEQQYPATASNYNDIPCWLDFKKQYSVLHKKQWDKVRKAKGYIRSRGKQLTPGRLIAELNFSFWTALFNPFYGYQNPNDPRFWPGLLLDVFPHLPKSQRRRLFVFKRLERFRVLRNRIFHHEPIWTRDLKRDHQELLESIGWISPDLRHTVVEFDTFPAIHAASYTDFRDRIIKNVAMPKSARFMYWKSARDFASKIAAQFARVRTAR